MAGQDERARRDNRGRDERGGRGARDGRGRRDGDRQDSRDAKAAREAQAKRHLGVMKAAFGTETQASIEAATIVEAGYAPEAPAAGETPTEVAFVHGNVVSAIFQAEKPVAVLDNASYRYPGGGYLRGWQGPEEDLCSEGNLYAILESFQKTFYDQNKQTASGELYTSRGLAIPGVRFTRHGEIAEAAVCVMAAPSRTRAIERNRSEKECDLALAERIDAAMRVLASFGAHTVIVPAFGCGQAGNDATQVAQLFLQWVQAHDGAIPRLEFALWRGADADAFKAVFAHRVQEEPAAPVEATPEPEEEDEGEADWEKYRISE